MDAECKVLMDSESESRKQRAGCSVTSALLVFTLCLAAAAAAAVLLLNTHTQKPERDQDSFDLHHTLRQVSNVRAAIHLEGRYNPKRKNSVEWKTQVDQYHSQGDFKLDHNEIVIPRSGLYFVYSQASFSVSCSSPETEDPSERPLVHLSHTVKRWSSTYSNDDNRRTYDTILHSVRTACQKTISSDPEGEGRWYSAVYMGAVFKLNEGDRLKTVMEERMLKELEDDPGKTFFGVFAL